MSTTFHGAFKKECNSSISTVEVKGSFSKGRFETHHRHFPLSHSNPKINRIGIITNCGTISPAYFFQKRIRNLILAFGDKLALCRRVKYTVTIIDFNIKLILSKEFQEDKINPGNSSARNR